MKTIFLLFGFIFHPINAQFDKSGVQQTLDAHNEFRSSIAKGTYVTKGLLHAPATNMMKMKWNVTIATAAQNHANKCPKGHDGPLEGVSGECMWFGNINASKGVNHLGAVAAKAWSSEYTEKGWETNLMSDEFFNSGRGHAIIMTWYSQANVGCGVKLCEKEGDYQRALVVCKYWGEGQGNGKIMYESGPTCSACPPSTTCDQATGLCDSKIPDIPEPIYKYDELVNSQPGYTLIMGFCLIIIVHLF